MGNRYLQSADYTSLVVYLQFGVLVGFRAYARYEIWAVLCKNSRVSNSKTGYQRTNSTNGSNGPQQRLKHICYLMILTYFRDDHLILWTTGKFKNSTFGGFCGEYIKNLMKHFFQLIFSIFLSTCVLKTFTSKWY